MDDDRVDAPSGPAVESTRRRFRFMVVATSVAAAAAGSVVLATHRSQAQVTTRGVTATLRVPAHPRWIAAGRDALWLALADVRTPVRDRPLLRLDLASDTVGRRVLLGGQASFLAQVGDRLLASVEHVGGNGTGPSMVAALDWRSGGVLVRRQFATSVGALAAQGRDLWALQAEPAALIRLDSRTLVPTEPPLELTGGEALGLAAGAGYVWTTIPGAAEVLRIDPATRAIARVRVGGFPVGLTVARGSVWFVDRDGAAIGRLDPRTLESVGRPIRVGGRPTSVARAGRYLFIGDATGGTVRRIDLRSASVVGPPIRVAAPAPHAPDLAVVSAGGAVWVSSFASDTLTRVSASSEAPAGRTRTATAAAAAAAQTPRLPRGARVLARIRLGAGAPPPAGGGALTVGEGAVWAMSDATSTLMRIDPTRNAVVAQIKVPPVEASAAGDGAVWLSHPTQNTVSRVDPAADKIIATIHAGPQPMGVAVSSGAVWIALAGGPSVARVDPATNSVVATIRVGPQRACCSEHMSVWAGADAVWVGVPNADELVRIDPATNAVTGRLKLPYPPCAFLVADASDVWSAGGGCADVLGRIDVRANRLVQKLAEPHAVGLGLAAGSLWVAVLDAARVDQVDLRTGRLVARLHVGGTPVRLAVGFGSVWVNDDHGLVVRLQPLR